MEVRPLRWKLAAVLLSIVAVGDLGVRVASPSSPGRWAATLGLVIAAVGVTQYAFGWLRIPRLFWRFFGPLFSVVLLWSVARNVGWMGTRLMIRRLSIADQLATVSWLVVLIIYAAAIVVPLYRLGEWNRGRMTAADEEVLRLSDTFG
jgi:hypothetical protein